MWWPLRGVRRSGALLANSLHISTNNHHNRYLANPRYTPLLTIVATNLCTLYAPIFGQSDMMDELFVKMKRAVDLEVETMKQVLGVEGVVECILMANDGK